MRLLTVLAALGIVAFVTLAVPTARIAHADDCTENCTSEEGSSDKGG
jgi:hypothetical protein